MEASQKTYGAIKQTIQGFISKKDIYRYAKLGVVLGLFHIPIQGNLQSFLNRFILQPSLA